MASREYGTAVEALSDLIETARSRRGWTWKAIAQRAGRSKVRGLSQRNLYDYWKRKRARVSESIVRHVAELFEENADEWAVACGFVPAAAAAVLSEDEVLALQDELERDDEVWIVSSRAFLEAKDLSLEERVVQNLRRGLTYKYFFPGGDQTISPYGNLAETSYVAFRSTLQRTDLGRDRCRCFGFKVRAEQFPYFSLVHSIVYYKRVTRTERGASSAFLFMETESGGGRGLSVRPVWCRLTRNILPEILSALDHARDPIADLGLPYQPLNMNLSAISQEYAKSFSIKDTVALYGEIRNEGSNIAGCASALRQVWASSARRNAGTCRYLDIGCGDGRTTEALLNTLKEAGQTVDQVTLVDPSPVEADLAEGLLKDWNPTVHRAFFEDASLTDCSFDLITTVHSLYTIDEAYLRKVYELLAPNGVAFIWIGALQANVLNSVCDALDRHAKRGRRNYAEDVLSALVHMGVTPTRLRLRHETYVSSTQPLVTSNRVLSPFGRKVVDFFLAGRRATEELLTTAATVAEEVARTYDPSTKAVADIRPPVTDFMIAFHRTDSRMQGLSVTDRRA